MEKIVFDTRDSWQTCDLLPPQHMDRKCCCLTLLQTFSLYLTFKCLKSNNESCDLKVSNTIGYFQFIPVNKIHI